MTEADAYWSWLKDQTPLKPYKDAHLKGVRAYSGVLGCQKRGIRFLEAEVINSW